MLLIFLFLLTFSRAKINHSLKCKSEIRTFFFEVSFGSKSCRHGLWKDKIIIFIATMLYLTPTTVLKLVVLSIPG